MTEPTPMPMCPMAETCKAMMGKPFLGVVPIILGIVFIVLGVLVIFEPRSLVWILAVAFVFMGLMMLMMASFMRKVSTRFQSMKTPAA